MAKELDVITYFTRPYTSQDKMKYRETETTLK